MNLIDIIILTILIFAAFTGMRDGLIIQSFSIIGIIAGIWLGNQYGANAAALFSIKGEYANIYGLVIILIATSLSVAILARLLRSVLQFAGFGLLDVLLGAAISVCKFLLILSVIFTAFDLVNHSLKIIEHKTIEKSRLYRPIANLSEKITPSWKWAEDQIKAHTK